MIFESLIVYKLLLTCTIVLALSVVAEHVSPKWAGILSGFPTGSAITLYFYALENGLQFSGKSAIYNMIGLISMQFCILGYYIGGRSVQKYQFLISVFTAIIFYSFSSYLISRMPITPLLALLASVLSFYIFRLLFSEIENISIKEKIKLRMSVIFWRAVLAAMTICLITGIAKLVGPKWAGLLSAFPTTLFPLLIIIHKSYGRQYAYSVIKHVPDGLGALLTYSFIIYMCYPQMSLCAGIVSAFSGALLYLAIYHFASIYYKNFKKDKINEKHA